MEAAGAEGGADVRRGGWRRRRTPRSPILRSADLRVRAEVEATLEPGRGPALAAEVDAVGQAGDGRAEVRAPGKDDGAAGSAATALMARRTASASSCLPSPLAPKCRTFTVIGVVGASELPETGGRSAAAIAHRSGAGRLTGDGRIGVASDLPFTRPARRGDGRRGTASRLWVDSSTTRQYVVLQTRIQHRQPRSDLRPGGVRRMHARPSDVPGEGCRRASRMSRRYDGRMRCRATR